MKLLANYLTLAYLSGILLKIIAVTSFEMGVTREDFCSEYFAFNLTQTSSTLCESIEIRSFKDLGRLCPCAVIDGSLRVNILGQRIPVMENATFPLLREVTHYITLVGLHGVKSLATFFPNLSVIRGEELWFGKYSVGFINLRDMENATLTSLNHVGRGSVFVNPTDWSDYHSTCILIRFNLVSRTKKMSGHAEKSIDFSECLKSSHGLRNNYRGCPSSCPNNCDSQGNCCHSDCYGGCEAPNSPTRCHACKTATYKGRCQKICPENMYKLNHFCVERTHCHNPFMLIMADARECLRHQSCPEGYEKSKTSSPVEEATYCVKCHNVSNCPRVCEGMNITNLNDLSKVKGCNIIKGSLTISDKFGGFDSETLKESFSSLREVRDFVHISNAPFKSLSFLQGIDVIRGQTLYLGEYALMVEELYNLESIFGNESEGNIERKNKCKIRIEHEVKFKQNPLLCPSKIWDFIQSCQQNLLFPDKGLMKTKEDDFNRRQKELENINSLNGYNASCYFPLEAHVNPSPDGTLKVSWTPIPHEEFSNEILFVALYRKLSDDVTIWNNLLPTCSHEWQRTERVLNESEIHQQNNSIVLTRLESYAKYEIRLRALSLRGKLDIKAQSKLLRVRTSPSNPSPPRNIRVESNRAGHLSIKWDPPLNPNGLIDHYIVSLKLRREENKIPYKTFNLCDLYKFQKHRNSQEQERMKIHSEDLRVKATNEDSHNELHDSPDVMNETSSYGSSPSSSERKEPYDEGSGMESTSYIRHHGLVNYPLHGFQNFEHWGNQIHNFANEGFLLVKHDDQLVENDAVYSASKEEVIVMTKTTSILVSSLEQLGFYEVEVIACQEPVPVNNLSCPSLFSPISSTHGKATDGTDSHCKMCSLSSGVGSGLVKVNESFVRVPSVSISGNNQTLKQSSTEVVWRTESVIEVPLLAYVFEIQEVDTLQVQPEKCLAHYEKGKEQKVTLQELIGANSGHYKTRLRVITMATATAPTDWIYFSYEGPSSGSIWKIFILGPIACAEILLLAAAYSLWRRYKYSPSLFSFSEYKKVPVHLDLCDLEGKFPSYFLLTRDQIKLRDCKKLGEGNSGRVLEGVLEKGGEKQNVAVKMASSEEKGALKQLLKEAVILQKLQRDDNACHIVKLFGVVTDRTPFMYVMELMENRDLKMFIRNQPNRTLPNAMALRLASEAADGMFFLASSHVVHRDLAARNCFLDSALTLKIGDFGLAVSSSTTRYDYQSADLPIRWMSPESLREGVFTSRTDVWSYGVVLWEMASGCDLPFQEYDTRTLRDLLQMGKVSLKIPHTAVPPFQDVMKMCWQFDPERRPSFKSIIRHFLKYLSDDAREEFENTSYYQTHIEPEIKFGSPDKDNFSFMANGKESDVEELSDLETQIDSDVRPDSYPGEILNSSCDQSLLSRDSSLCENCDPDRNSYTCDRVNIQQPFLLLTKNAFHGKETFPSRSKCQDTEELLELNKCNKFTHVQIPEQLLDLNSKINICYAEGQKIMKESKKRLRHSSNGHKADVIVDAYHDEEGSKKKDPNQEFKSQEKNNHNPPSLCDSLFRKKSKLDRFYFLKTYNKSSSHSLFQCGIHTLQDKRQGNSTDHSSGTEFCRPLKNTLVQDQMLKLFQLKPCQPKSKESLFLHSKNGHNSSDLEYLKHLTHASIPVSKIFMCQCEDRGTERVERQRLYDPKTHFSQIC